MIKKIYDQTFESIIKNISSYVDLFLLDGIICFNQLNLSTEEQLKLMDLLSKFINFQISGTPHTEDHRHTFNRHKEPISPQDLFIEWHIENIHKETPETIACWNMTTCLTKSGAGDTVFVNMENFYAKIPEQWRIFLKDIKIKSTVKTDNNGKFLFDNDLSKTAEQSVVIVHPVTNQLVLRIPIYDDEYIVSSYQNKNLNKNDLTMMEDIKKYIKTNIADNKNIKERIIWKQGDLVVVDLFKMAHAVYGGFSAGDRILHRIWGYYNV